MAIGAGARWHGVIPRQRESRAGVIEGRIHPVGGVVTGIASLREVRRDVVGVRGALVILQVAAHASRSVQAVVVVDVTIGAGARRNRVQAGECETCARMVEGSVHPVGGVMACIAGLREVRGDVIRIGGSLIIL